MTGRHPEVPKPEKLDYGIQGDEGLASQEAEALQAKIDLSQKSKEYVRRERLSDTMSFGIVWLVRVAFVGVIAAVVSLASHYLIPESYHWLSESQLSSIKTFLFSTAVIKALLPYFQRREGVAT